jgi:hypothetical protein
MITDSYTLQALQVLDEAGLKIQLKTSDGARLRLTVREAMELAGCNKCVASLSCSGCAVVSVGKALAAHCKEAGDLAYGDMDKIAAREIGELEQIKQSISRKEIAPGTETARMDEMIVRYEADLGVVKPLLPASGKRLHVYIQRLCGSYMQLTGEDPKVSPEGPFVRFVRAVTKHFRPSGTKQRSPTTIRRAMDEWDPSQKVFK